MAVDIPTTYSTIAFIFSQCILCDIITLEDQKELLALLQNMPLEAKIISETIFELTKSSDESTVEEKMGISSFGDYWNTDEKKYVNYFGKHNLHFVAPWLNLDDLYKILRTEDIEDVIARINVIKII